MAPRIAILTLGHADYPTDAGGEFARQARGALAAAGIDVVWAGKPLTDVVSAAVAGRDLLRAEPEGVIVFLATWIECSTALAAIREVEHLPLALWAVPMFEQHGRSESTGSFVAACALKPALVRMGYRPKTIIGLPADPGAAAAAKAFCRAAHCTERLKRTRLGLVGYSAMSIYPGTFDHVLLRRQIGPEVVHLDTYTLVRAAEAASPQTVAEAEAAVRASCQIEVQEHRLQKACRLAAGAADLVSQHHLHALNVKCQHELSQDYGMTACVPMALLAGAGVVASCEGDVMVTVSQAMLHYAADQTTTYGDILDLQEDEMLLSSCGFAPFSLADPSGTLAIRELDYPGFDGVICSCALEPGPVTFARLAEGRGDYHLVYGLGQGVKTDLRQGRFPALRVVLERSADRLIEHIPSQHFALCRTHVDEELEDVCRVLGIQAIRV